MCKISAHLCDNVITPASIAVRTADDQNQVVHIVRCEEVSSKKPLVTCEHGELCVNISYWNEMLQIKVKVFEYGR